MTRKNFFCKLNFLIVLAAIFTALVLGGCDNLLSSDLAKNLNADSAQIQEGYGTVSGSVASANTSSAAARTAIADINLSNISYTIFAENGSQKIFGTVEANGTFFITLPFGTWAITVNGSNADAPILSQTKNITLSTNSPSTTLDFNPTFSTNPALGEGTISLNVSFPARVDDTSTIQNVEYILQKDETKIPVNVSATDVANGSFIIQHTLADLGAYNLTINFYGDFSNLVYRIDQIVNVYANLTTDEFHGSAPYISGGQIVLDDDRLKEFQNTTLYVGGTDINGKPASDTNTGTQFDPLATLNRALELMNNSDFDNSTEFRVFLKGDVGDGASLSLNEKLTIASADGTAHTITGLGRTFTVASNAELTVQDINFEKIDFAVATGSTLSAKSVNFKDIGFTVEGTVDMDSCIVDGGNSAGGVYVKSGSMFTMKGGEIKNCHSNMYGGGLCIQGTVELTGTKLIGCSAENLGGAVYIANTGTFKMNGGEISGNTTDGDGAGVYVADGGTFTMSGSAKITEDNDVYISSGVINIADELSEDFFARITIPQDQYTNGTQIIYKNGAGTITDGICDKFTVTPDSNGIEWKIVPDATLEYGVLKSEVDLIYVRGTGAGWYEDNGKGDIIGDDNNLGNREHPFATIQKAVDTVLSRNDGSERYTIYVDGEVTLSSSDLSGANEMASFATLDKTLNLTIKALSETKKATLNADGANTSKRVINATPNTANGGILNLTLEKLIIKNGNHTTGRGGGIHFNSVGGTLKISDSDIIDNKAKRGGGISVFGGTFTATNCKISGNKADNTPDSGGGVYLGENGKLELENVEISGNTASGQGGGIFVGDGIDFEMTDGTTISKNKAASGGGIFVANTAAFTLTGGTISENECKYSDSGSGGGIRFGNDGASITGKVTIRGGSVIGNSSYKGGGIYSAGTLEMVGSAIIENNKAIGSNGLGGGVYIQSGGKMTISDGKVRNNTATGGAGIYAFRAMPSASDITVTMSGGEISGNISDKYGGGIYVDKSTVNLNGGVIRGNKSNLNGGGINVYDGIVTMTDGEISGNTSDNGGGVYVNATTSAADRGKFTMTGGTINGNTGTSKGSGITIEELGEFTMEGGLVSGNTSGGKGTGAYIDCNATLVMKDAVKFAEDDDIYLYTNTGLPIPTIQIAGALTEGKVATVTPSDYVDGRKVLSAASGSGVTIDQTICDKFAVTPEGSTKWKIMENPADNTGILKKGDSSGGISITVPGIETYTFTIMTGNPETPLTDGMTLQSGSSMTLKQVEDSKGNPLNSECVLEIRDASGNPFPNSSAIGTPTISISVPNLPVTASAQVYMKATLDGGAVVETTISVTISP